MIEGDTAATVGMYRGTTATSGSPTQNAPVLYLRGSTWDSTTTTTAVNTGFTVTQTGSGISGTLGNTYQTHSLVFAPVAPTANSQTNYMFNGKNGIVYIQNANTNVSTAIGSSWDYTQFAVYNQSGSTRGVIPNGGTYSLFVIGENGTIGSVVPANFGSGAPVLRNVLDNGSGLASFAGVGKTALSLPDTTGTTGITIGVDTNLYRSAADTLKTDDNLIVAAAGTATNSVATIDATQTLTNKRVTKRVGTTASSATPTPNADTDDVYTVTALAAGATFGAPTGTPTNGQSLIVRIKDNGTARTLSWNVIYRAIGTALPMTTVISKTLYLGFLYNTADTRWDCVVVSQEA